jgi:hypothetical protein
MFALRPQHPPLIDALGSASQLGHFQTSSQQIYFTSFGASVTLQAPSRRETSCCEASNSQVRQGGSRLHRDCPP